MTQNLPGASSLIHDIDKKMMVTLRDKRVFIGYLRIVDQFGNLVLHKTIERIFVGKKFCDIYKGIFIIRGENIVIVGESDLNFDIDAHFERVGEEEIFALQREEQRQRDAAQERKKKALQERGLLDSMLNELWMDDS